jgi:hypothetical protein
MEKPVFDAASFVEIDLSAGSISSAGSERLALIPTQVLTALEPGSVLDAAALDWGRAHGRLLSERVDFDADNTSLEALASHLGGTLAAFGLGRLNLEIRGDALVFRAEDNGDIPVTAGIAALLEGFLSGYLSALGEYPFAAVYLGKHKGCQFFWAGNSEAAADIRSAKKAGKDPLSTIDALVTGER